MPTRTRRAISSAVAIALALGHWPTSAYAACGASSGAGNGPPSISATEVSTAQALQILRRRQDETVAAQSGGGGGNVAVASLSPPPAPQAAPPPPKPAPVVAAPPAPKPAPKVAAKPEPKVEAPVEPPKAKPVAQPDPKPVVKAEAKPAAKPEIKPAVKPSVAPSDSKPEPQPEAKPDADKSVAEAAKPDTTYLPKAGGEVAAPAAKPDADKSVTDKTVAEAPKPDATYLPKAGGKVEKPSAPATDSDKSVAPAKKTVVAMQAPKVVTRSAAPAPVAYGGGMKDDYVPERPAPTRGMWAQGYYDTERQKGWTLEGGEPGAMTSKEHTVGMLAGGDVSLRAPGHDGVLMLGALGGYSSTHTKYNDQVFTHTDGTVFNRTDARDDIEGGNFGLYGLYASRTWTADLLVKFDFLGLTQKDVVEQQNCNDGQLNRTNTADVFNVVVAANIAHRYMLSRDAWFEPTFGFRYTHVDYSNIRQLSDLDPVKDFGLEDGEMFRVQGGIRIGTARQLGAHTLVATLGGFLYSDVAISGISKDYRDVIEGELRGMGQFTAALSDTSGMTYLMQLEVRGGDDMIGFGAKGGLRYEW